MVETVKIGEAFRIGKNPEHNGFKREMVTGRIDRVHPLNWLSAKTPHRITQISRLRFGDWYENKHSWVIALPRSEEEMGSKVKNLHSMRPSLTVAASLYTYLQEESVDSESHFEGNAEFILSSPVRPRESDPTAIIFYSVGKYSRMARGLGEMIINQVSAQYLALYPDVKLSTLSPMRQFKDWLLTAYSESDIEALRNDDDVLHMLAMQYLGENIDPVQRFHLGNGAYIGDVNLQANAVGSADDEQALNIMVNYVYPTDMRERQMNKSFYADGIIQFAPQLGLPSNDSRFKVYCALKAQRVIGMPYI